MQNIFNKNFLYDNYYFDDLNEFEIENNPLIESTEYIDIIKLNNHLISKIDLIEKNELDEYIYIYIYLYHYSIFLIFFFKFNFFFFFY